VIGPPEVGAIIILPLFDDRATHRACAREQVEQRVAIAPADRALERVRSSEKRWSISSTASLFDRNTSRHITGSDAAIRVKSRNPPAEY